MVVVPVGLSERTAAAGRSCGAGAARCEPFEGVAVPRVVSGQDGWRHDTQRLHQKEHEGDRDDEGADRGQLVQELPPEIRRVSLPTRRGMPSRPSWYWGMNVSQKPMNSPQKCHLPRLSLNIRPVNFGYQ